MILGITFKENCPDIRNTKIVDIYSTLNEYSSNIVVYDPWADSEKVFREYGIRVINNDIDDLQEKFDAVVLGVAHSQFKNIDVRRFYLMGMGWYMMSRGCWALRQLTVACKLCCL